MVKLTAFQRFEVREVRGCQVKPGDFVQNFDRLDEVDELWPGTYFPSSSLRFRLSGGGCFFIDPDEKVLVLRDTLEV